MHTALQTGMNRVGRVRTTVWTRVKQVLLKLYGLCIRVRVIGRVRVPLRRSFIVAANHLNGADSVVLQVALRTRLFFAASVRWFSGRVPRFLLRNFCDAIPVETGDVMGSLAGMRECIDTLRAGGSIGIYPEGKFNLTGQVTDIQPGTAYLAARSGVPVLPVLIQNLSLRRKVDSTNLRREGWTGFLSVVEQLFNTGIVILVGEPVRPGTGSPRSRDELRAEVVRINAALLREFEMLAGCGSDRRQAPAGS